MSEEEIASALERGAKDPVLTAFMNFVEASCAITVGETTGYWTASTVEEMRRACRADFIIAMEKAEG
jgi:hypothetical protein